MRDILTSSYGFRKSSIQRNLNTFLSCSWLLNTFTVLIVKDQNVSWLHHNWKLRYCFHFSRVNSSHVILLQTGQTLKKKKLHGFLVTFLWFSFHYNSNGFSFPEGVKCAVYLLFQSNTHMLRSNISGFCFWGYIKHTVSWMSHPNLLSSTTSDQERRSNFPNTISQ